VSALNLNIDPLVIGVVQNKSVTNYKGHTPVSFRPSSLPVSDVRFGISMENDTEKASDKYRIQ